MDNSSSYHPILQIKGYLCAVRIHFTQSIEIAPVGIKTHETFVNIDCEEKGKPG